MKITPILDRVILREIKTKEKKTKSGIILPSSVKETPCEGKIVAINADYKDENGIEDKNTKPFLAGYYGAVSKAQSFKSREKPDTKNVIYEEFIPDGSPLLPKEPALLESII